MKYNSLIMVLFLTSCGEPPVVTKTVTKEIPIPIEVLIPVMPDAPPPVTCQVFKDWNVTTLPTTHQVKGTLEIGLSTVSLTAQDNDTLPFNEFIGTDAADVTKNFALRCSFKFEVKNTGNHTFNLESDDGSELYINGVRVINNGGAHGMLLKTATVNLPEGIHDMQIRYYQGTGPKGLTLSVLPAPETLGL